MEHQLFCKEEDSKEFYEKYKEKAMQFLLDIGFDKEHLRFKDHDKLAHYASAACDIQFLYPMGWEELNGIHNRGSYDLSRHQEYSGKSMLYTDPFNGEKYIPSVVEYSIGADRLMLAVLCEAFDEEELEGGEIRSVLRLAPCLAAYKAAVLPLQKNLSDSARPIFEKLRKSFPVIYDDAGSIGKRYRRQDEIGTPFCITIDFDTLDDNSVTVRERDSMEQVRLKVDELESYIGNAIKF